MAVRQINTADYDYAMMLNVINKSYKGKADITLSAFDTTAAPDVKVGSVFEDNGAIFIVETSDITPTGYAGITNSTTFYLYWDESGTAFIYSNTAPTWSDVLQGWYNGNDRAFFSMFKDSGGTLYENKSMLIQKSNTQKSGNANPILHIQDQKSNNTNGGTFTAGAWRTRDLGSIVINTIAGASLSSNQITLPIGTYKVNARAPGYQVIGHKIKLRNITDGSDILIGSNCRNTTTDNVQTDSFIKSWFSISGIKTIELQHYCSGTQATTGFGLANNFSVVEVYAEIFIEKIG